MGAWASHSPRCRALRAKFSAFVSIFVYFSDAQLHLALMHRSSVLSDVDVKKKKIYFFKRCQRFCRRLGPLFRSSSGVRGYLSTCEWRALPYSTNKLPSGRKKKFSILCSSSFSVRFPAQVDISPGFLPVPLLFLLRLTG